MELKDFAREMVKEGGVAGRKLRGKLYGEHKEMAVEPHSYKGKGGKKRYALMKVKKYNKKGERVKEAGIGSLAMGLGKKLLTGGNGLVGAAKTVAKRTGAKGLVSKAGVTRMGKAFAGSAKGTLGKLTPKEKLLGVGVGAGATGYTAGKTH